jgi:hypothetical protein
MKFVQVEQQMFKRAKKRARCLSSPIDHSMMADPSNLSASRAHVLPTIGHYRRDGDRRASSGSGEVWAPVVFLRP